MPTTRVPCSNASNIGERKTSTRDGQTSCKVWLISVERRLCSNKANTRNLLKFAGCPKPAIRSQPLTGRSSPRCEDMWRRYCCLTVFVRSFVKRFALCYRTVVLSVCLSVSLSVCNVRALWPNGWTDQDKTWHLGRPRSWPHCVRW